MNVKTVRDTCAIEKKFEERPSSARSKSWIDFYFSSTATFLTNTIPPFFSCKSSRIFMTIVIKSSQKLCSGDPPLDKIYLFYSFNLNLSILFSFILSISMLYRPIQSLTHYSPAEIKYCNYTHSERQLCVANIFFGYKLFLRVIYSHVRFKTVKTLQQINLPSGRVR
jgi:hypothetical protein